MIFAKKFIGTVAACLMAGALFVGCGDQPSGEQKTQETAIGMISNLNMSEQKINATLQSINGAALDYHYVCYDSLNAMQMGLNSDSIDEMSVYKSVADYLILRDSNLQIDNTHKLKLELKDKFCCAVKDDNKALLEAINGAIGSMQNDGTLEALTKKYITDLKGDEEPEAVELPSVPGKQTVKVAVTGDLPPLDLIRADGTPAGFNTAVLAEISKRIEKNFELVSVDSAARASALASGKVDMVFWVRVPSSTDRFPVDFDRPAGVAVSEQYFIDEIVHVGKNS